MDLEHQGEVYKSESSKALNWFHWVSYSGSFLVYTYLFYLLLSFRQEKKDAIAIAVAVCSAFVAISLLKVYVSRWVSSGWSNLLFNLSYALIVFGLGLAFWK